MLHTYDNETVKYWYRSISFFHVTAGIFIFTWSRAGREIYTIDTLGLDGVE